jgi:hypothetical protein
MHGQYPKFVIDSRLARRRLVQAFESRVDWESKRRSSPVSDRTLATAPQKNIGTGETSIRDLFRSITSLLRRIRSRTLVKQPDTAKRDIIGFGFLLVLADLSEIAAAQTNNAVFWLLVGPTPLAPL